MDEAAGSLNRAGIDWSRPWFSPWRDAGERVEARLAAGWPLHEALDAEGTLPVRFVEARALPAGEPYEDYIRRTASCPVRPGLHDFFNGLCWIGMPRSKSRLNELQAAEIRARGIGGARGPVRDAITLFDENGALLDAPAELWEALLQRDWRRLFVELRPLWTQARLLVVGHALLEKLVLPRKELTAHVWRYPLACSSPADADAQLAAGLTPGALAQKPFAPLPLLGIPDWAPENQDVCFYDDAQVFRPRRGQETTQRLALRRPA